MNGVIGYVMIDVAKLIYFCGYAKFYFEIRRFELSFFVLSGLE